MNLDSKYHICKNWVVLCILILLIKFLSFGINAEEIEDRKILQDSYSYEVAIATIFQNEAPYLKEWIEYHKILGVQHFYLFNNLSKDDYLEVLLPYITSGEVDLIQCPYTSINEESWLSIQRQAYTQAIQLAYGKVKWLALIDSDEFIVPTDCNHLGEFLDEYENYGGLCINWQMFGTSFVSKIPKNKLLIETLILKGPKDFVENKYVKSIVRPEAVASFEDVHIATYKAGFFHVNPNKEICKSRFVDINIDKIRINHYWSRDEDYFYNVKVSRRVAWDMPYAEIIHRMNSLNAETDTEILRFVPALRKKIFTND
jgi:hypothetical protein